MKQFTHISRRLSALLAVLLAVLVLLPIQGHGAEVKVPDGLEYEKKGDHVVITAYLGSAARLEIPDRIEGLPVTEIGEWAFYGCTGLTNVTIPGTVTSIGDFGFGWCSGLTSVTIPGSVTYIGECAFSECYSLEAIYVYKSNPAYSNDDRGVLFNKDKTVLIQAPGGITGAYQIPDTVTTIGYEAFSYCNGLTAVTIPDSVVHIGVGAFYECVELASLTMGKNVEAIHDAAFHSCYALDNVVLPSGVAAIGEGAFRASGLKSVVIPGSVESVGYHAFSECGDLTDVTICEGVRYLEEAVFWNCESLKRVTIPVSLKTISNCAFEYCFALEDVYYAGSAAQWGQVSVGEYNDGLEVADIHFDQVVKVELSAPAKPYKIANVVSGSHVYWKAVAGAEKYGLWRSEDGRNGTYKWIANPTVPHFTDTTVETGKTYFYKVTAAAADSAGKLVHSDMSEAIGITYVSTPDITVRKNTAAGVELGWQRIEGAMGYAIYRKSYDGYDAWVRIGTIEGNETFSWTDESVKNANGTVYRYTIRALAGSDMKTLSGCRNTGRTMVRLSSQVMTGVSQSGATSVLCKWTTSSRVTGYEVRFLVDGEVYKTFTVGNYKTGTKTFTGLESGGEYTVQVRTYKKVEGVGSFYSDWSSPKTVTL